MPCKGSSAFDSSICSTSGRHLVCCHQGTGSPSVCWAGARPLPHHPVTHLYHHSLRAHSPTPLERQPSPIAAELSAKRLIYFSDNKHVGKQKKGCWVTDSSWHKVLNPRWKSSFLLAKQTQTCCLLRRIRLTRCLMILIGLQSAAWLAAAKVALIPSVHPPKYHLRAATRYTSRPSLPFAPANSAWLTEVQLSDLITIKSLAHALAGLESAALSRNWIRQHCSWVSAMIEFSDCNHKDDACHSAIMNGQTRPPEGFHATGNG